MRLKIIYLTVALVVVGVACSGSEPTNYREEVRYPDDQGIVTAISFDEITLDGDRSFPISEAVDSFTTRGHDTTPLVHWQDRYVHVGLDGDGLVIWVAGIGIVVEDDDARVVLYTGVFEGIDEDDNAIFQDGTVLRLAEGIDLPATGDETAITLDADRDLVTELKVQG